MTSRLNEAQKDCEQRDLCFGLLNLKGPRAIGWTEINAAMQANELGHGSGQAQIWCADTRMSKHSFEHAFAQGTVLKHVLKAQSETYKVGIAEKASFFGVGTLVRAS